MFFSAKKLIEIKTKMSVWVRVSVFNQNLIHTHDIFMESATYIVIHFILFDLMKWNTVGQWSQESVVSPTKDAMTQCNDDCFMRNKNSSYTYDDDCRYIRHKTRKTHHSHKMRCAVAAVVLFSTTQTIDYTYVLHRISDVEDYIIKLFYCRFSSLSHYVSLHRTHQQLKHTLYIHVFPPILTLLTFDYMNCLLCCGSPVRFFYKSFFFCLFVRSFFLFTCLGFLACAQHAFFFVFPIFLVWFKYFSWNYGPKCANNVLNLYY